MKSVKQSAAEGNFLKESLEGEWPGLKTLILSGNSIGDEGAEIFAKVLMHDTPLKFLGLDSNNISDKGAKELGIVLCMNKELDISLSGNPISDELLHLLDNIREIKYTASAEDLRKACIDAGFIEQGVDEGLYQEEISQPIMHDEF